MNDPEPSDERLSTEPAQTAHVARLAFERRVVTVFGTVSDRMAQAFVDKLLALDAVSREPIQVLLSSPGGHLESGDAMHDALGLIAAPVMMIGTGWVGSAAAHLYLGVPRAQRFCTPNTRFLIHQPSGGAGGPATDIAIQAQEIGKARERIARTISEQTGQPLDKVLRDVERDHWMSPSEAMAYGMVSRIVRSLKDTTMPAA